MQDIFLPCAWWEKASCTDLHGAGSKSCEIYIWRKITFNCMQIASWIYCMACVNQSEWKRHVSQTIRQILSRSSFAKFILKALTGSLTCISLLTWRFWCCGLLVPDRPGRHPSGVCVYLLGKCRPRIVLHSVPVRKWAESRAEQQQQQQAQRGGMWSTSPALFSLVGCSGGGNALPEPGDFVPMPPGYTSWCLPCLLCLPPSQDLIHTLKYNT